MPPKKQAEENNIEDNPQDFVPPQEDVWEVMRHRDEVTFRKLKDIEAKLDWIAQYVTPPHAQKPIPVPPEFFGTEPPPKDMPSWERERLNPKPIEKPKRSRNLNRLIVIVVALIVIVIFFKYGIPWIGYLFGQ